LSRAGATRINEQRIALPRELERALFAGAAECGGKKLDASLGDHYDIVGARDKGGWFD